MRPVVQAVHVTAMCMNGLDATIVNPALFAIAADPGCRRRRAAPWSRRSWPASRCACRSPAGCATGTARPGVFLAAPAVFTV
ncbi:hypothetical protein [Nonomuraea gerenzanensis]|uniref:hypothetical protein n=1 Tax=Nonomuraea gerenzanensis TaxID=93944 RepID=UPI001CD966FA|nr:hypothetical protein [Nonomuraea gerenzanensis]UBU18151.1 hypothetical protein LCN96_24935 [Nonomuraea gerenzanensis]